MTTTSTRNGIYCNKPNRMSDAEIGSLFLGTSTSIKADEKYFKKKNHLVPRFGTTHLLLCFCKT